MIDLPSNLDAIIHIGAGCGDELPAYLASDAQHIILVEPEPTLAESLRRRIQQNPRIQVLEAAITDNDALNQLTAYNLPEANSLYQPSALRQLFPGLKAVNYYQVNTLSIGGLLREISLTGEENLIVIQAPGAEYTIVKGLADQNAFQLFSYIHLTANHEPLYDGTASVDQIINLLRKQGYDSNPISNTNLDWPQWAMKINPSVQRIKELEPESQELTKNSLQRKSKLNDAKSRLERVEKELKRKNIELEDSQRKLQSANDQLRSVKAELEITQGSVREKDDQKEALQKQIGQLLKERDESDNQVKAYKAALKKAKQEIKNIEGRVIQLQEERKEKNKEVETRKKLLEEARQEARKAAKLAHRLQQERDKYNSEAQAYKAALEEASKNIKRVESKAGQFKEERDGYKEQVQVYEVNMGEANKKIQKAEESITQLREERDSYNKQIRAQKAFLEDADQKVDKFQNRESQLQKRIKQLEDQLNKEANNQKEFTELKQRMEYLFGQQRLQLEQAANVLGRHVTTVVKTSTKELEAGIALQQQYGLELPSLETQGTLLPATIALQLAHQLKSKSYDLIIDMGSSVTTSFMAQTLQSHNDNGKDHDERGGTQISHYIDPSEDDLPKRIVCFEHNRSTYNQLQDTLKNSGLGPLVSLQFAPMVPYTYREQEYLFYDCANFLQQVAKLLEGRHARIFILISQSDGDRRPELIAALPQILQHLAAHTLDLVVNISDQGKLIDHWCGLLEERGLEYSAVKKFGKSQALQLTINP